MLSIQIPPIRLKQTVEMDDQVRQMADLGCRVWIWLTASGFITLLGGMFVLGPAAALTLKPVLCWLGLSAAVFASAFVARAIIWRVKLNPVLATATEYYTAYPDEFHPTALEDWRSALTEAGVGEIPEGGISPWLGGRHARALLVLSATHDLCNRTASLVYGDATHERAVRLIGRAAEEYAADWRVLDRRRSQLEAAQARLNSHYGS